MDSQPVGLPTWVESLLLGNLSRRQRMVWVLLLVVMIMLVPLGDYSLGRGIYHLNLYPIPVVLSTFLFGELGLMSVLVTLALYHAVQVRMGLEGVTLLVNNLGQLSVTFVVGLICCWLTRSYRALYQEKVYLARDRHRLLLSLVHELRSPLFAIRGIVRNTSRNVEKLSGDDIRRQLNEAQAAIAAINQDVEGLTQVFRSDLNTVEARLEPCSASVLLSALQERHPREFHPDHSLLTSFAPEVESVFCDRLLTVGILDNLVSNSLRHAPGGEVRVSIEPRGDEVLFRVTDQGPGVLPSDRERIFGRYERGTHGSGSGFGVGLYLVVKYAEAQGGRVQVDESAAGASFSFCLPRSVRV